MISSTARYLASLAALFALAACETTDQSEQMAAQAEPQMAAQADGETAAMMMDGPYRNEPLRLFIDFMDPDSAMADAEALRATLAHYEVPEPAGGNLGQWISAIRSANGGLGSDQMAGVGGVPGRTILWLAQETLDASGNFVAPPGADVHGQIEEECDGQPGYMVNADGSGRLCVTVFTTKTQGASSQTRTVAERFLVLVDPGGFQVESKSSGTASAFPTFTSTTGLPISQGTASGFNYKLWASGLSIHVIKLWRDENYNPASPNFHPVSLNAIHNRSLKAPNAEACIDMMFVDPPPATLPPDMAPPSYCLGRCDDPPIINTK